MDKIRSILSSATGNKKVGPPVPPRPPLAAVQKALEKTRNLSNNNNNNNNNNVPIAKGRTVIYTSTNNGPGHHIEQQQQQQQRHQVNAYENKCFDTKLNDSSSTGLKVIIGRQQQQNGNNAIIIPSLPARVHENGASIVGVLNKEQQQPILHTKSPVPKPRLKTPPLPKSKPPSAPLIVLSSTPKEQSEPNSSYSRLLMQNQNSSQLNHRNELREEDFNCGTKMQSGKNDQNIINKSSNNNKNNSSRDDELKEKLLNEIFSGRLVEASNVHLRYNTNSNLKRSSSCDVLNDRNSIVIEKALPQKQQQQNCRDEKVKDRKVMFHEMLISELSEMRRAGNDTNNHHRQNRLSAAKSCSDLSPTGNKQMTIIEMRDDVKIISRNSNNTCLISLEDSGVEDEEKADDCSSSGVGDSWDSCKEMQNRINISLPGLPPLPKSLSGIELSQHHIQRSQQNNIHQIQQQQQPQLPRQSQINITSSMSDNNHRKTETTLDTQLAILRREMYSLRQLDLSLLSQLWALNESIQEFRTIIEQENFSQQSPSPSNSDLNSLASDDEEVTSHDGKSGTNKKITLTELPKNDRTNVKRMNISPPAPPMSLSSKC